MRFTKILLLLFITSISALVYGQDKDEQAEKKKTKKFKLEKGFYAEIQTNRGETLLRLHEEKAPLTVANFIGLAEGKLTVFDTIQQKEPFYDGILFHRVIANFMIQAGDPTGVGSGGPGYKFFDETDNQLKHDGAGILSMANAGPNTNGSQFFITHVATPHLNGKHTVFGQVVQGQEVVDAIRQGDTIQTINIKRKGLKNKLFYNPSKVFAAEYERRNELYKKEQERLAKLAALNKVRLVEAQAKDEAEYKKYFKELILKDYPNAIQTESGLMYIIEEEGEADAKSPERGDKVSLHYTGTFLYGSKFDSSIDRGKPLNFDYQIMGLIPGFNEGVGFSKKGMKVKLFIPYYLAYGKNGKRPTIPPYADLIFDIELLDIQHK